MIFLFMDMIDDDENISKFRDIFNKYKKIMYYTANNILKNHHHTEDAMQIVLYRVAKNIHKLQTEDEFALRKYLETITKNVALTMAKKSNTLNAKEFLTGDFEDDTTVNFQINEEPLAKIIQKSENENLYAAINELECTEHDMLLMYYFYDMPIKEIAAIMGINYETAKKRMQRILKKLEKKLRKGGFHENG